MTESAHMAAGAAAEFCQQLREMPHGSLPELYTKMTETTPALSSVGLASVVPFAQAYRKLTGRAGRALQAGRFTDVPTTERLAGNFAGLYFDALVAHVTGDHDAVPMSWQQLLQADCDQPPWLQLALGVNAHIGHDLPLALRATAVNPSYGGNFFGLNRAIRKIAPQLAPAFLPTIPPGVRYGVAAGAANVIIRWRRHAWDDFIQLRAGRTSPYEVERRVANRGARLQRVSAKLGAVGLTGA